MKKNPFIFFRPGGGTFVLALLLGLVLLQTGCQTPEPAVAADPRASYLVEMTRAQVLLSDIDYLDNPAFFDDPPTLEPLQQLQILSDQYGYDFKILRVEVYEDLLTVEPLGE